MTFKLRNILVNFFKLLKDNLVWKKSLLSSAFKHIYDWLRLKFQTVGFSKFVKLLHFQYFWLTFHSFQNFLQLPIFCILKKKVFIAIEVSYKQMLVLVCKNCIFAIWVNFLNYCNWWYFVEKLYFDKNAFITSETGYK